MGHFKFSLLRNVFFGLLLLSPFLLGTSPEPACEQVQIEGEVKNANGASFGGRTVFLMSKFSYDTAFAIVPSSPYRTCKDLVEEDRITTTTDDKGRFVLRALTHERPIPEDSLRIGVVLDDGTTFLTPPFSTVDTLSTKPVYSGVSGSGCSCVTANDNYVVGHVNYYERQSVEVQ